MASVNLLCKGWGVRGGWKKVFGTNFDQWREKEEKAQMRAPKLNFRIIRVPGTQVVFFPLIPAAFQTGYMGSLHIVFPERS
jgi:hypothetical protein